MIVDTHNTARTRFVEVKVSGAFTQPMQTPDGETFALTGKRFERFFTTVANWKNDQIVE